MSLVNLAASFELKAQELGDAPIQTAVVGPHDDSRWDEAKPSEPLVWEQARKLLDYSYDSGFGGADCHAVVAWSQHYVYYVHEYDGATRIAAMPRNPMKCLPTYEGTT